MPKVTWNIFDSPVLQQLLLKTLSASDIFCLLWVNLWPDFPQARFYTLCIHWKMSMLQADSMIVCRSWLCSLFLRSASFPANCRQHHLNKKSQPSLHSPQASTNLKGSIRLSSAPTRRTIHSLQPRSWAMYSSLRLELLSVINSLIAWSEKRFMYCHTTMQVSDRPCFVGN